MFDCLIGFTDSWLQGLCLLNSSPFLHEFLADKTIVTYVTLFLSADLLLTGVGSHSFAIDCCLQLWITFRDLHFLRFFASSHILFFDGLLLLSHEMDFTTTGEPWWLFSSKTLDCLCVFSFFIDWKCLYCIGLHMFERIICHFFGFLNVYRICWWMSLDHFLFLVFIRFFNGWGGFILLVIECARIYFWMKANLVSDQMICFSRDLFERVISQNCFSSFWTDTYAFQSLIFRCVCQCDHCTLWLVHVWMTLCTRHSGSRVHTC